MTTQEKAPLLRGSLAANALFSTVCGLSMILLSGRLAEGIGAVTPTLLIVIGVILLLFALDLGRTVVAGEIPRSRVVYFIVMDGLWVIGSALVLWVFSLPFTVLGRQTILGIAIVVGIFAVLQYSGFRRLAKGIVEVR